MNTHQRPGQSGGKVAVIGAGPGGLTSAMLLAARGFDVTIFEKGERVGGRNAAILKDGYKFDTGPTFLMMKGILDEVFEEAGRHIDDYLTSVKLEPMYRSIRRRRVNSKSSSGFEIMSAGSSLGSLVAAIFRP